MLHLDDRAANLQTGVVATPAGEVHLSPTEVLLLRSLAQAGGEAVSRDALLRAAWGEDAVNARVVDQAIRRLRAKLEPEPSKPRYLVTAHGLGYRLIQRVAKPAPIAQTLEATDPGPPRTGRVVPLSDGSILLDARVIIRGRVRTPLTDSEARLLEALVLGGGTPVDRETLYRKVWGVRSHRSSRAIDNAVHRLRQKVEHDPGNPVHLVSVRGRGYQLFTGESTPWYVHVRGPEGVLQIIALSEAPLRIGRAGDNDLVLPAGEVSRYHATLRAVGQAVIIQDLQTGNGTHVEGTRIDRAVLQSGSKVTIRPFTLEITNEGPAHEQEHTTRVHPG